MTTPKTMWRSVCCVAVLSSGGCIQGSPGRDGRDGPVGLQGPSCSVAQAADGQVTMTCPDGTSATIAPQTASDLSTRIDALEATTQTQANRLDELDTTAQIQADRIDVLEQSNATLTAAVAALQARPSFAHFVQGSPRISPDPGESLEPDFFLAPAENTFPVGAFASGSTIVFTAPYALVVAVDLAVDMSEDLVLSAGETICVQTNIAPSLTLLKNGSPASVVPLIASEGSFPPPQCPLRAFAVVSLQQGDRLEFALTASPQAFPPETAPTTLNANPLTTGVFITELAH